MVHLLTQVVRGGFAVSAIIGEEGELVGRKNLWTTIFEVEDPRSKVPHCKGKFLDVYQALEVARYDIQYCDWKARQDVLTIMLLHEKVDQLNYALLRYKLISQSAESCTFFHVNSVVLEEPFSNFHHPIQFQRSHTSY